jgi:hypothetical protein
LPPEFAAAYWAVSRLAARVLSRDPQGMLRELDEISGSLQAAKIKGD